MWEDAILSKLIGNQSNQFMASQAVSAEHPTPETHLVASPGSGQGHDKAFLSGGTQASLVFSLQSCANVGTQLANKNKVKNKCYLLSNFMEFLCSFKPSDNLLPRLSQLAGIRNGISIAT